MTLSKILAIAGILTTGMAALSVPAQAFSFTTNFNGGQGFDAKKDILLDSVTLKDGTIVDQFSLVSKVSMIYNDEYIGGNTGAASTDLGDWATTGVRAEKASNQDIVAVLNNNNLNNIVDTEDTGRFIFDLAFESVVDNIYLWERGMNSQLKLQALDEKGNLLGAAFELSNSRNWDYAGFSIDTQEINGAQKVGSLGISLADLGVSNAYISGLRIISEGKAYNGPDWKVMGSVAEVAQVSFESNATAVPEPASLLGLAVLGGAAALRRRKQQAA
ncbi:MAG: PEP-CTERM sorting domain-containing protein [Synechococcales cyanobacterium RM1_1_8]|nr:PEP-CTERM sorting domain-containing protein [Synechococcales cyanobacterium RM1_1_8]